LRRGQGRLSKKAFKRSGGRGRDRESVGDICRGDLRANPESSDHPIWR